MLHNYFKFSPKTLLAQTLLAALSLGASSAYAIDDTEWNKKNDQQKAEYASTNFNNLSDAQKEEIFKKLSSFLAERESKSLKSVRMIGSGNRQINPSSNAFVGGYGNLLADSGFIMGSDALVVGDYGSAIGYQAKTYFPYGIAIGRSAIHFPYSTADAQAIVIPENYITDGHEAAALALLSGLALGNNAVSSGSSISVGGSAITFGAQSVSIGMLSGVGSKDYRKYILDIMNSGFAYERQTSPAWYDYLTKRGMKNPQHNGYGLSAEDQKIWDQIMQEIRDTYGSYLQAIDYDHLDTHDQGKVMDALRFHYATKDNQPINGVALGTFAYTSVDEGVALGAGSEADRAAFTKDEIAPYSKVNLKDITGGAVSVGTATKQRQIINLADGTQETDAVNLRQLRAAFNSASGSAEGLDTISGDKNITVTSTPKEGDPTKKEVNISLNENLHIKSVDTDNVRMDGYGIHINNGPSMTAEGINANNTRITNVAPGREGTTDAVNMQQLGSVKNDIAKLGHDIHKTRKEMRGIGANATAIASLPQVMHAGKSQIAAAGGVYRDATAVAIGWSHASKDGRKIIKLNGAVNSNGDGTAGIGFGYEY